MSAEDLTTQAGLSVQQDLALVNLLGITHVERNGHHYVNGMAALPRAEQQAFLRRASAICTSAATARCGCASADGRIALALAGLRRLRQRGDARLRRDDGARHLIPHQPTPTNRSSHARFLNSHEWLSLNTATVRKQRGAEVALDRIIDQCAERGIRAISPWRDQVAAVGIDKIARQLKAHGIGLSGYCRGGFFPAPDAAGLAAALDDNRRAIDEAKTLGAPCLVLVVGSLPGALEGKAAYKDLARARGEVRDGIAASLEYAREVGMPLAIEPLHPMQAADRACINTLEQALDLCDELDPQRSGMLGVALDIYHVWWDPKLEQQIARAGKQRLLAYHVCDWLTPTRDLLSDRGMMGDGVVELKKIRGWVEAAGFDGFSEVEIFSALDWWQRPGEEVLDTCIERHRSAV